MSEDESTKMWVQNVCVISYQDRGSLESLEKEATEL